jgi:hypothetical protein
MNAWIIIPAFLLALLPAASQAQQRQERRSLLDNDPAVVYLDRAFKDPIMLTVIKEAPVYSDKDGNHRLGFLKANQTVRVEAITEKAYRVRGQGARHGIAGWVPPWAFSSKDPDFVANLRKLYDRQIAVQAIIEAKEVAIGMTLDEITQSRGKPTKTSIRRTAEGESGTWEYVDYEEVKHYINRVDPISGVVFRQFSHMTQEEKGRTTVEFENDVITAIEESENRMAGANVRIVVPPLLFRW